MADSTPTPSRPAMAPEVRAHLPQIEAIEHAWRRLFDAGTRPLYTLYTRRLRREVLGRPRPRHIAVIMDGNRRWAIREGFRDHAVGHRRGAEKALEFIDWCADLGIREVTLWALSVENLDRPSDEIGTITDVATDALSALADGRRRTRVPIRLHVIGRRELLPERLQQAVQDSAKVSRVDGALDVTIALAYSGRDELLEAFRTTVRDLLDEGVEPDALPERLTADEVARHLYTTGSSDPDLIVRTSGEVRLSGFLPWQSVYSEYYFCEAYWPAFREI
ncbi:MAG TPA: polyprenyl diphosphate synthase, partial [Candidatus Saccharimonadales bacterium]|nr:polyprenyl diphosphate synthase [Candidatus Saccharimonadales bacterium]